MILIEFLLGFAVFLGLILLLMVIYGIRKVIRAFKNWRSGAHE